MDRFMDDINHPLLFVFALLLALWGLASVLTYGFKALGWTGPASFVQHP